MSIQGAKWQPDERTTRSCRFCSEGMGGKLEKIFFQNRVIHNGTHGVAREDGQSVSRLLAVLLILLPPVYAKAHNATVGY